MIAPIKLPESPPLSRGLRIARRLVASALLRTSASPGDRVPEVKAWQAWLFAGWVVLVAGAWLAHMAGWL